MDLSYEVILFIRHGKLTPMGSAQISIDFSRMTSKRDGGAPWNEAF